MKPSYIMPALFYFLHPTESLPSITDTETATNEIVAILDDKSRNDGATFSMLFWDIWQQPFWAVAVGGELGDILRSHKFGSQVRQVALRGFIEKHRDVLSHTRSCVGVWIGRTGRATSFYLDVSAIVHDRAIAMEFGNESNQCAIFSLEDGEEITLSTDENCGAALVELDAPQFRLDLLDVRDVMSLEGNGIE